MISEYWLGAHDFKIGGLLPKPKDSMEYTIEDKKLELDISLSKSSVIIQEHDKQTLELEFSGLRKKTAEELFSFGFRNNRLYVKETSGKHYPMLDAFLHTNLASDVIVKIPADVMVSGKIASINGDIKAAKMEYRGDLKTVSGKIVVEEISTDGLNVQNISGNVFINRLKGFLKGRVVAGDLTVEGGEFNEISLNSVSGDVRLSGDFDLEEDGEISTVSGDVHLNIHQCRGDKVLTITTLSGNSSLVGDYPDGAIVIKPRMPFLKNHPFKSFIPSFKDMFSSFFTTGTKGESEVEVEAESNVEENENTKMILEMLSAGKITVEEAEKLIRALGGK